jgi:hypothetical protein
MDRDDEAERRLLADAFGRPSGRTDAALAELARRDAAALSAEAGAAGAPDGADAAGAVDSAGAEGADADADADAAPDRGPGRRIPVVAAAWISVAALALGAGGAWLASGLGAPTVLEPGLDDAQPPTRSWGDERFAAGSIEHWRLDAGTATVDAATGEIATGDAGSREGGIAARLGSEAAASDAMPAEVADRAGVEAASARRLTPAYRYRDSDFAGWSLWVARDARDRPCLVGTEDLRTVTVFCGDGVLVEGGEFRFTSDAGVLSVRSPSGAIAIEWTPRASAR